MPPYLWTRSVPRSYSGTQYAWREGQWMAYNCKPQFCCKVCRKPYDRQRLLDVHMERGGESPSVSPDKTLTCSQTTTTSLIPTHVAHQARSLLASSPMCPSKRNRRHRPAPSAGLPVDRRASVDARTTSARKRAVEVVPVLTPSRRRGRRRDRASVKPSI